MNNELISFLEKYWAQLTLLIGAIGYCMKSILDLFIRRYEIKFTNLQMNRLEQIKVFYKSYLELELKLRKYYYKTMHSKLDEVERQILQIELAESWRTFIYELRLTRLYVRSTDLKLLDEIENGLDDTNKSIDIYWIDKDLGVTDKESIQKMREIREEFFVKKIPNLLKRLEVSLRKTYR